MSLSVDSQCLTQFGDSTGLQVWEAINDCFDVMPIAATIDDRVNCCSWDPAIIGYLVNVSFILGIVFTSILKSIIYWGITTIIPTLFEQHFMII